MLKSGPDTLKGNLPVLNRRFTFQRTVFTLQHGKEPFQRRKAPVLKGLSTIQRGNLPMLKGKLPVLKSLHPMLKGQSTFQRRMDAEPLLRYS